MVWTLVQILTIISNNHLNNNQCNQIINQLGLTWDQIWRRLRWEFYILAGCLDYSIGRILFPRLSN